MKFYKYKNISSSTLIKTGAGLITGLFVASASSTPTVKINDGISGEGATASYATQTLTISGGAMVPGKHAENTLTSDATAPVSGHVVVIGATTYTYRTALSTGPTIPNEVLIGASASIALDNLKSAVNGTAGIGTTYSTGTVKNASIIAFTKNSTTILFVANVPGTAANSLATTTNDSHLSWAATTLGGSGATQVGVVPETFTISTNGYAQTLLTSNATAPGDGDYVEFGNTRYTFKTALSIIPVPFQVLIGASASIALDNLKSAINATTGAGTTYSSNTTKNADVQATTKTSTTLVIFALNAGVAYNNLLTLTSGATLTFPSTTIGGGGTGSYPAETIVSSVTYSFVTELSETSGAPAIANEILWVTNDAAALANMKKAINLTGTLGTDYSTGTVINPLVNATTTTSTTQIVAANTIGTVGNGIQVAQTFAHATWGAATLTGGLDVSSLLINTFTPVAATPYNFGQPIAFGVGLYITVSGTVDLTVFYD